MQLHLLMQEQPPQQNQPLPTPATRRSWLETVMNEAPPKIKIETHRQPLSAPHSAPLLTHYPKPLISAAYPPVSAPLSAPLPTPAYHQPPSPHSAPSQRPPQSYPALPQTAGRKATYKELLETIAKDQSFASKSRVCSICSNACSSGNWYRDAGLVYLTIAGGFTCKSCTAPRPQKKRGIKKISMDRVCLECNSGTSSGDWYRAEGDAYQ